jgi:Pyruvate/2-oxoacid:ferredoxin oxidoreductase delta subunit
MGLFKEVKKPVIRQASSSGAEAGSTRPRYAVKTAPCIHSCPSGTDVRGWLLALAQHEAYGRTPAQAFEFAWRKILEHNPFPAVCGRVCQHPCELSCNRKAKEGPVAVNHIEQLVGDFAIARGLRTQLASPRKADAQRVAIVGAGPAGLSAAYHLALAGCAVTVIDAAPQPGGMMRYRIPRSMIPAAILDAEIENILQLGIELRTECVVGRDISMEQFRRDYRAVFFADGLQKAAQLELRAGQDGEAATVGDLPANLPMIPETAPAEAEPRVLNTVSVAIAQGRAVAETIAAFLEGRAVRQSSSAPVIRADHVKLDWYAAMPRSSSEAAQMTEAEAIAEAARCMSCGMCMDCETCWMYCSKNCFSKLPKGEHYRIKLDLCNGCGKCAEACPCGYIEMN